MGFLWEREDSTNGKIIKTGDNIKVIKTGEKGFVISTFNNEYMVSIKGEVRNYIADEIELE